MQWLGSYNTHEAWHYEDKSTEPKKVHATSFPKKLGRVFQCSWRRGLPPAALTLRMCSLSSFRLPITIPEAWEQGEGGEARSEELTFPANKMVLSPSDGPRERTAYFFPIPLLLASKGFFHNTSQDCISCTPLIPEVSIKWCVLGSEEFLLTRSNHSKQKGRQ